MSTLAVNRCVFCTLPAARIVRENELAVVVRDAYPVSPGHSLVIPRRHVGSLFEVEPRERDAIFELLRAARVDLDRELQPSAYNIGINDGPAAGQTIQHLHVHLIPRFTDDSEDARGGVRWIFPKRADYWSKSPSASGQS
jgi:diadenosine tetraphosphate (Ap4A) HIT family hydrolase